MRWSCSCRPSVFAAALSRLGHCCHRRPASHLVVQTSAATAPEGGGVKGREACPHHQPQAQHSILSKYDCSSQSLYLQKFDCIGDARRARQRDYPFLVVLFGPVRPRGAREDIF